VTPNRSNTDIFPPRACCRTDAGLVRHADPAGSTRHVPRDRHGTTEAVRHTRGLRHGRQPPTAAALTTSGCKQDGSTRRPPSEANRYGGGTTGPKRPIPPNSQTSSGGGAPSTRTGKNALNETVADCMKLWEPATHMSKADWSTHLPPRAGRLDQVTKQVMQVEVAAGVASPATACQRGWTNAVTGLASYRTQPDTRRIRLTSCPEPGPERIHATHTHRPLEQLSPPLVPTSKTRV
jgi:hypothetical protein